jgi:N-acetyl sugar amidotransferase
MEQFKRNVTIDYASFEKETGPLKALYGLPENVTYCRQCVISNQRPSSTVEFKNKPDSKKVAIQFDEDDVCDACKVAEKKQQDVDWDEREKKLKDLCDKYRRNDGEYDCLVPGSGGKDSVYAALKLKYEYGMHPLTVTWAPHIYTDWGRRNHLNWIHGGFDNFLITPNGRIHRLLTRLAVENLFHPFQPFIFGQKQLAPVLAKRFNIPLVFYGENEAEYGNPAADMNSPVRDTGYFSSNDDNIFLSGISISDLKANFGLDDNDLKLYRPLNQNELDGFDLDVHYLGYYLKWHPQTCYYLASEKCGFEASPERTPGTYSKYNSIDDKVDDLHYFTTYIKFGIGRASYDAAQEVRSGDLEREEAVYLVKRFDGEFPQRFADELFNYLSIPESEYPVASRMFEQPDMDFDYFMHLADRFRSPHLWSYKDGNWSLRKTVWEI